jgi:hypothetical protein
MAKFIFPYLKTDEDFINILGESNRVGIKAGVGSGTEKPMPLLK